VVAQACNIITAPVYGDDGIPTPVDDVRDAVYQSPKERPTRGDVLNELHGWSEKEANELADQIMNAIPTPVDDVRMWDSSPDSDADEPPRTEQAAVHRSGARELTLGACTEMRDDELIGAMACDESYDWWHPGEWHMPAVDVNGPVQCECKRHREHPIREMAYFSGVIDENDFSHVSVEFDLPSPQKDWMDLQDLCYKVAKELHFKIHAYRVRYGNQARNNMFRIYWTDWMDDHRKDVDNALVSVMSKSRAVAAPRIMWHRHDYYEKLMSHEPVHPQLVCAYVRAVLKRAPEHFEMSPTSARRICTRIEPGPYGMQQLSFSGAWNPTQPTRELDGPRNYHAIAVCIPVFKGWAVHVDVPYNSVNHNQLECGLAALKVGYPIMQKRRRQGTPPGVRVLCNTEGEANRVFELACSLHIAPSASNNYANYWQAPCGNCRVMMRRENLRKAQANVYPTA